MSNIPKRRIKPRIGDLVNCNTEEWKTFNPWLVVATVSINLRIASVSYPKFKVYARRDSVTIVS